MERRYFDVIELRVEASDDGPSQIQGVIPYNSKSEDLGGFVEEIKQGAFARTLRERDQVALWSHDPSRPLGRRSKGTLALEDSPRGLRIVITPPDTSWGRDALESIRRGDVDKMSFGFNTPEGGDSWREWGGKIIRSLLDVDLFEVSPVVFGAYPKSATNTRDLYGDVPEIPADLRGATEEADSDNDDQTRARLDIEKRKLDLMEMEI